MIKYTNKEIDEAKKLIDPNSDRYSEIVSGMWYRTVKDKEELAFEKLPEDMSEEERNNLLKWFFVFGDHNYKYRLSKENIVGERIS